MGHHTGPKWSTEEATGTGPGWRPTFQLQYCARCWPRHRGAHPAGLCFYRLQKGDNAIFRLLRRSRVVMEAEADYKLPSPDLVFAVHMLISRPPSQVGAWSCSE